MIRFSRVALCAVVLVGMTMQSPVSLAQDQKVIVTVNDMPITSFDIQQRINLWKLLGEPNARKDGARKLALNELIDDIAAIEETKKLKFPPTEKEVDEYLLDYAKGLKTDERGLKSKLKGQGISVAAMRQYLAGRLAFNRLVRGKFKEDFSVSDAEVKKRQAQYRAEIDGKINSQIAKIEADPRRRPITVYQLMRIRFPVDAPEGGMTQEVLNSRAIEVNTFVQRFKGCGNAKAAASGIFNVKVDKKFDVDASKLDKQMRQTLEKLGQGRAIGPVRSPNGLEAIAFCGSRKIVPPKIERPKDIQYPTADQVRNVLVQEKYASVAAKYGSKFRKGVLIEFRDSAYGP